jgi:hypothetical protein
MKTLARCVSVALLLVPSVELVAQPQTTGWIPFETIEQSALPIVRVRLNGTGPYRVVVDVSFNDFVLDTTIVDGSGLKLATQGMVEIDFYGRKEKVPVVVLDELGMGELSFPLVRTLLIEGEDGGTSSGGLRSYGRIGRDLLESARLTIHYPRRLLLLEPSPDVEVPEGSATYQSSGRFLLVPSTLTEAGGAQESVHFILDTASSSTVLDRKWAMEKGFASKGSSTAAISSLRIGGFEKEDVPVLLGVMKDLPYGGDAVGVIGADFLRGLSVTFDFARDLIWFVNVKEESS